MEFSHVGQELFRRVHNWLLGLAARVVPRWDDGDDEQAVTLAGPAVCAAPIAVT